MKRPIMGLIVCIAAFFVARQITLFFGENISGAGGRFPSLTQSKAVKAQTNTTSLPPLSNVVFHTTQKPKLKRQPAPPTPQTDAPDPSTSLAETTNDTTIQNTLAAAATQIQSSDSSIRDPLARVALSLVGVDPTAEEYWAAAINDLSLSDKEREDLIEDLNEVGFADPQNPTPDEIPLILNRLQIIETYAPAAMDENNARSFAEAYKDLSNMLARLTAQ